MDTSETYIKMCEKVEKIQRGYVEDGDYYYHKDSGKWDIVHDKTHSYRYGLLNHLIWLPRQDQLQEMVKLPSPFHLLEHLNIWITTETEGTNPAKYESMEQLWLAFYMKEKFKKVWDGDKWIEKG